MPAFAAGAARRARLSASGDWALAFPSRARLKFVALVRGHCWIRRPGQEAQAIAPGDVFLIGRTPYVIASDPALRPVDGLPLYETGDVARLGDGEDTVLLGGSVHFSDAGTGFLLDALPPFLRIASGSPAATAVARTLDLLELQSRHENLGAPLVAARLAELLVAEAIRACAAHEGAGSVGWLAALGDRQVGRALQALHGDIAQPWTTARLAAQAGMSRSAFVQRFGQLLGRPPMDYLRLMRMALAHRLLREGMRDVGQVALSVGYASPSAFGLAFRRSFGIAPGAVTTERADAA